MNRKEFQRLSKKRISDLDALIQTKNFDGAYYIGGYAIECALKSCIAKLIKRHDIPDKKFISETYTHNFISLIKLAGLEAELNNEILNDVNFSDNWNLVKDWKESSRYELHNKQKVKNFYNAITDKKSGVLKWLIKYW